MRLLLAFGLFVISLVVACPPLVEKYCRCEELHNGVKYVFLFRNVFKQFVSSCFLIQTFRLDCSHTKGYDVVQILRQNQAMLGLVQELKMHKVIKIISHNFEIAILGGIGETSSKFFRRVVY